MVTQIMMLAFGLSLDNGPILIGNMDTKQKLDRLKALYEHFSMKRATLYAGNLKAAHSHYVDVRNTVAHSMLAGRRISAPNVLVFSSLRIQKKALGHVEVIQIHLEGIRRATTRANDAAQRLRKVADRLPAKRSRRPAALAKFPPLIDPNRQKKRGEKRRRPRKGPPR